MSLDDRYEKQLKDVLTEIEYAFSKWGDKFDDENTLNDWVTYICMYATDAAMIKNQDDPDAIYRSLIKAAGLAMNAANRVATNRVAGRHYDLDRSNIPEPRGEHGAGRAVSVAD